MGLWAPNCAEWVLVQYATAKLGAILVTINPACRTDGLAYVLQQSGDLVAGQRAGIPTSDHRAMIAEVRPDCPELREVIILCRSGLGGAAGGRAIR